MLSTGFHCLKIDHLIKRIGISELFTANFSQVEGGKRNWYDEVKGSEEPSMLKHTSHYVALSENCKLHLKHIYDPKNAGDIVFLLHGAIENGKIFYTSSNKGIAPYLAENGYQCYVADLRGRGESYPKINGSAEYGQTESIIEDIPACLEYIFQQHGQYPKFWIAHSWGGVLLNSVLARFPQYIEKVTACAYFGTKRSLYNQHPSKLFQANLLWYTLAPLITKKQGFLNAKRLGWGSDNETKKSHKQSVMWAKRLPWVDSDDDFDYGAAVKSLRLPPIMHVAGVKDKALAQPIDIQRFIDESGKGIQELKIYGKAYGHKHNYDHIDMLTSPHAREDQFNDVLIWFRRFAQEIKSG